MVRPLRWIAGLLALASGVLLSARLFSQEGDGGFKANLDLPFDAGGNEDNEEDPPEGFIFYDQQYEGDGVFFCLDRSGSTQDSGELDREKKETVRVITEFSSRVQFGVVFYDRGVIKWPPSGRPAEATEGNKGQGRTWTMSTQGGGGTCVKSGLLECLNFISRSSAKRNIIIWLGDGCNFCMGMNEQTYSQQTLAEVKARNIKHAKVNAICVGPQSQVCESFPKALAAMNGGTYSRIPR